MSKYICAENNCNKQYTVLGYCDEHWNIDKFHLTRLGGANNG